MRRSRWELLTHHRLVTSMRITGRLRQRDRYPSTSSRMFWDRIHPRSPVRQAPKAGFEYGAILLLACPSRTAFPHLWHAPIYLHVVPYLPPSPNATSTHSILLMPDTAASGKSGTYRYRWEELRARLWRGRRRRNRDGRTGYCFSAWRAAHSCPFSGRSRCAPCRLMLQAGALRTPTTILFVRCIRYSR